jgi:hypothetical protein
MGMDLGWQNLAGLYQLPSLGLFGSLVILLAAANGGFAEPQVCLPV